MIFFDPRAPWVGNPRTNPGNSHSLLAAANLPIFGIPAFGIPAFGIPVFGISDFGIPGFGIPDFGIPRLGISVSARVQCGFPYLRNPCPRNPCVRNSRRRSPCFRNFRVRNFSRFQAPLNQTPLRVLDSPQSSSF